jgi:serine protease Do
MEHSPIISVIKKTSSAVVSISISKTLEQLKPYLMPFPYNVYGEDLWKRLGLDKRDPGEHIKIGGGSGFFISEDGIVLTNKHVVIDPDAEYTVVNQEEEKYQAKVMARDPINDIAILKVDNNAKFPHLKLGDSSDLLLGQTVIAIGTALGEFQNTVSTGIISGLSRFITARSAAGGPSEHLRGLIQTDAAINPGNSGGPLLDIDGKVIGINSAVVFGAQNVGFAIPINAAEKDLESLKKFGRIRKPTLGIRHIIITEELKKSQNLAVDYGAWIVPEPIPGRHDAILPNSPAAKVDLKENDIILEFNGEKITTKNTLQDILSKCEVGQKVVLKYLRDKTEKTCEIVLVERK